MSAMKRISLFTLVLAALAMACGAPEPEPVAPQPAGGKSSAEVQASFTQVREMQEAALAATADLVARADSASVEELEEGMTRLNEALLRGRQETSFMSNLDTEEALAKRKELRRANVRMNRAYAKLVEHHPNPTTDLMQLGGDASQ